MRIGLALFTLALCLPSVARAAFLGLSPDDTVYSPGESMLINVVLVPQGSVGPGEVEFTIRWRQESGLLAVGAAMLDQPVAFAPGFVAAPGSSDCSDLVGQISGTCSLRAIASAAVPGAGALVLQLRMQNLWIAPTGYEFCSVYNGPGCVSAWPASLVAVQNQTIFGVPAPGSFAISVGTISGDPRIRPVPEPGSAGLVALGMTAMAWYRRLSSGRAI